MVISEDKQEQVDMVDIRCLFLQLPTMSQRRGRNNYLGLACLVTELLMLTCRLDQNSTEYKFRERALLTSIILIAFSAIGALERKGGKEEMTEGGREGGKKGDRKEGRKAVHKLWACSLFEISDKSCF